jgi:hypothetical protein
LERALTLHQTGVNIRDDGDKRLNNVARTFESNPWGGIACQYAQSTRKIPERKWKEIILAASAYISERSTTNAVAQMSSVAGSNGRGRIMVSDDEADKVGATDDED